MAMQPAVCLEMLYGDLPLEDKIRKATAPGFRGFEFWGWRDKNVTELVRVLAETGSRITNFSGHRRGSPISANDAQVFLGDVADASMTAIELGCPTLMILSNELGDGGRVVNRFTEIPAAEKHENMVRALGRALKILPDGMSLVIEPLNTMLDHPGNYLSRMSEAVAIVDSVGDPRVSILADFYHFEMMGERWQDIVSQLAASIGYVHIADVPGRHEPGTGQVDWRSLLRALQAAGYDGTVGFEYAPEGDSDESLERVAALWQTALTTEIQ
jgi:hydroxypyruvate isomerase